MSCINVIWQVDSEKTMEKDWLYFFLEAVEFKEINDNHFSLVLANSIVITDGYPKGDKTAKEYFSQFSQQGFRVGIIHLSDEWFNAPVDFYQEVDFVFRNYYRPDVSLRPNVYFLPLGYKRGYHNYTEIKPILERQYVWSFAGQLGGKLTRRTMMLHAEKIPGGYAAISQGFNDSSQLSFEGYVKLMGNSVYALSPGGNSCVETFRVYEAMESGAIPIVENPTRLNILKAIAREVFNVKNYNIHQVWRIQYWRFAIHRIFGKNYWLQVYGDDFPCLQCSDWSSLAQIIQSSDAEALSFKITSFWSAYKKDLKMKFSELVTQIFPITHVD